MAARTAGKRAATSKTGRELKRSDPGATLSDAFVQDVLADWQLYGAAAIASVRAERPHDYLKLITGIFPKETGTKVDALDQLTDEQLAAQLAAILAQLAAGGADTGARVEAEEAP